MGVQEGKVAPGFSLPAADGKMVAVKAADHPQKVLETLKKARPSAQ